MQTNETMREYIDKRDRLEPIHINAYFHIIIHSNGDGNVSSKAIFDQMMILNAAFSNQFKFILKKVRKITCI